jgi:hypothetical protein
MKNFHSSVFLTKLSLRHFPETQIATRRNFTPFTAVLVISVRKQNISLTPSNHSSHSSFPHFVPTPDNIKWPLHAAVKIFSSSVSIDYMQPATSKC